MMPSEVEEVVKEKEPLPEEPKVVNPEGNMPGESPSSQPTETGGITDPTPGAVTAFTPKAGKKLKGERFDPIPVGTNVRIGTPDHVEERFHGSIAVVTVSPQKLCTDPDCKVSPRDHYHQDPEISLEVKVQDETRAVLSVSREDLETYATNSGHQALVSRGTRP